MRTPLQLMQSSEKNNRRPHKTEGRQAKLSSFWKEEDYRLSLHSTLTPSHPPPKRLQAPRKGVQAERRRPSVGRSACSWAIFRFTSATATVRSEVVAAGAGRRVSSRVYRGGDAASWQLWRGHPFSEPERWKKFPFRMTQLNYDKGTPV